MSTPTPAATPTSVVSNAAAASVSNFGTYPNMEAAPRFGSDAVVFGCAGFFKAFVAGAIKSKFRCLTTPASRISHARARARHEHACAMTMHGSVDGVKGLRAVVIGLNVSSMSHGHAHMHASCLRACSRHRQKTAVSGELGDAGQGRRNPRTRAGPMCTLHAHVFIRDCPRVL